ncbi:MAG: energy transducer TonB [Verrucomicrobiae bacterium]|nr:energy transducer TonB [Verrucomicrobiae bacterium]
MRNSTYTIPKSRFRSVGAVVFGGLMMAALFLAIPLSQLIDPAVEAPKIEDEVAYNEAQEEIEEMKEEEQSEEPEEAEPQESMEMAQESLSIDLGGVSTGGIAVPGVKLNTGNVKFEQSDTAASVAFEADDLDTPPRPISQARPVFPASLKKKKGIRGTVTLVFLVDESGNVMNPKVHKSTNSQFDKSAISAVKKWRFEPGMKDGKRVKSKVLCPINFQLTGEPSRLPLASLGWR